VPDHAGFAAAITVREDVLRTALQAGYANGSDKGKRFAVSVDPAFDLSDSAVGMLPELFLGRPDVQCEGATNLLVVTLPMWGRVTITVDQVAHDVDMIGELELTLTPTFRTGPLTAPVKNAVELDQFSTVIAARSWTSTVTSAGTPPQIAALITGTEFRDRFTEKFSQGVFIGKIALPSIDASFLGPIVDKSGEVHARVRNGALLIGLRYTDATHDLVGDAENLQDFARGNDVAAVIHPNAVDVFLAQVHEMLLEAVENEGASLDSFTVSARNGYFQVNGSVSNGSGSVDFSFRIVRYLTYTLGGTYFTYLPKGRWVNSRTWDALDFRIENVTTDASPAWWVVLLGEVIGGILTLGWSILVIEGMADAAAANFGARVQAAKAGMPPARVRRTIPPPGGIAVRVGLDQFDITTAAGAYVGISVRPTPSAAVLFGPKTVPDDYKFDGLRYILRVPSSVSKADPALRIQWVLEDSSTGTVLRDEDGAAANRWRFEFTPGSFATTVFTVRARLYRRLGFATSELGTTSVDVHMRGPLAPKSYVRWRWAAKNPQVRFDAKETAWRYYGELLVNRWSEWHRTDQPCRAVTAHRRYRFEEEEAERLPFSLRLLENHRKGICPYCFYGGPAGVNASL
jgi:hypothetical protein